MIARAKTMKDKRDSQDLMMMILIALLQGNRAMRKQLKMICARQQKKKAEK